jgi:hypothetical protein
MYTRPAHGPADANGEFGLDADGRRQAARCQPPGPFGTHNKPRHRPGPGDPDARAGPGRRRPVPQLPLHRPVLRHGQAPLLRTTQGGSKARGLLSGRYEKFLCMYELIGKGTIITTIYNNLAMTMYVPLVRLVYGVSDMGYGGWRMGHLI